MDSSSTRKSGRATCKRNSTLPRRQFLGTMAALGSLPGIVSGAIVDTGSSFNRPKLELAVNRASHIERLHSMIVSRNANIAMSRVFRGPSLETPVNVKSISKTLVSALVGAAIDRREISGLDQTLSELIPDLLPPTANPRVGTITIEDLLTMRAGLERTSGENYDRWISSSNWIKDALSRPVVDNPGRRMRYSTGSYHVLGAVLSRAGNKNLLHLARERLGKPLDVVIPQWTRDPQGFYLGGNEMSLSPLSLHRFGELYQQAGRWQNKVVLSEAWVDLSWQPRTQSQYTGHQYGYGWYIAPYKDHNVMYAPGYGGQMLYVVPDIGLTAVFTSNSHIPAREDDYFGLLHNLMTEVIDAADEA